MPVITVVSSKLSGFKVCVACFHVTFADILESESGASGTSGASGKLAVEQVIGYTPIFHTWYLTEPAKTSLTQHGQHTGNSGPCQNVVVRYSVLPGDAQNAFEAAYVEGVQTQLLSQVYGPFLTSIEESAEDAGLIDAHLGVFCEHPVVPHPFRQLGHGCCGFPCPPVDLCVKRLVGRDGGPKVCKVLYHFQGVVVDARGGHVVLQPVH